MPAISWLPSERAWLNELTETLVGGDIALVRSIPRWGLTMACGSIAETLGASAVLVDGRAITEANQKQTREKLDQEIAAAIERSGYAQLIFDDYGRAIRRSQGAILHSMLYRLLVDSSTSRDTGALLVARLGDALDLNFSGSPLISRARTSVLPALTAEDADSLGVELIDLQRMTGELTWLARRFMGVTPRQGQVSVVEHMNHDRRRVIEALPPAAIEVLAGARRAKDVDAISREALRCVGRFGNDSAFEPASLVSESSFLEEVRLQNPGWPVSFGDSVERFANLLAGVNDAIWIDRYLLSEPARARAFFLALQRHTTARLCLLVSDEVGRPGFASEVVSALSGVGSVSVRFMHRHDRHRLHDRHLILPSLKSGFVLPTAGVILGKDIPGSAVSVPMSALPIDYAACWGRGTQVFSPS